MNEFLDKLDPSHYMFSMVHLPTGRNAINMLQPTEPVIAMFQRYFEKFENVDRENGKHKPIRQRLPSTCCVDDKQLELVGDGDVHRLPFVGRSSQGGGYCLRMLDTHRMEICLTQKQDTASPIVVINEQSSKKRSRHRNSTSDAVTPPESESKKQRKRPRKTEQFRRLLSMECEAGSIQCNLTEIFKRLEEKREMKRRCELLLKFYKEGRIESMRAVANKYKMAGRAALDEWLESADAPKPNPADLLLSAGFQPSALGLDSESE